jgi:Protein of unknown function (DUF1360)
MTAAVRRLESDYAGEDTPLATYGALIAAFTATGATVVAGAARSGRLPERFAVYDLALAAVASQRLARLISKARVTSVLRAPLTRYRRRGRPGEVDETPRRSGAGLALGQLVVCPFCMAQWAALGFVAGLVFAPRTTRTVSAVLTVASAADLMQEAALALLSGGDG